MKRLGKEHVDNMSAKGDRLEKYLVRYSEVNAECIIKAELVTVGIRFTKEALEAAKGYKSKSYYLFSFDRTKIEDMGQDASFLTPEDIRISGGPYQLRPTVVQSRINNQSPYQVEVIDEKMVLCADGQVIADVEYPRPMKSYYSRLSDGSACAEITPTPKASIASVPGSGKLTGTPGTD